MSCKKLSDTSQQKEPSGTCGPIHRTAKKIRTLPFIFSVIALLLQASQRNIWVSDIYRPKCS